MLMAEKVDRRVRKTKAQLRAGLARLMQKKSIKEITVKELVDEVDINRSTFYLHYSDIYQMLESVENELMDEIAQVIEEHPLDLVKNGSSYPMIEHIFTILDNNKDIYNKYKIKRRVKKIILVDNEYKNIEKLYVNKVFCGFCEIIAAIFCNNYHIFYPHSEFPGDVRSRLDRDYHAGLEH